MRNRLVDIYWAAGFLEGEGCFDYSGRTPRVRAHQVQKEPLDRLDAILGPGRFDLRRDNRPNHRDCWEWQLHGSRAVGVMLTLWTLLSPSRQVKIEQALKLWMATPRVSNRAVGLLRKLHSRGEEKRDA
jgi:hypothetical protein